ncbi:hypothetical protein, partial [Longimycelium tulufanense]|uniref:hypothetical protein n=1 Tax=Longimycelium tulufanense TaxID=907463 RepID=UPI001E547A7B
TGWLADLIPGPVTGHTQLLGLSAVQLLAVVVLVAGGALLVAASLGAVAASTTTGVLGVLVVLGGLAHLVLMGTVNPLGFAFPHVVATLAAGTVLLVLGCYGRFAGRLPPDNPYRRARRGRPDEAELAACRRRLGELEELARAELAVAEGHPTPEQELLLLRHNPAACRAGRFRAPRKGMPSPGH